MAANPQELLARLVFLDVLKRGPWSLPVPSPWATSAPEPTGALMLLSKLRRASGELTGIGALPLIGWCSSARHLASWSLLLI